MKFIQLNITIIILGILTAVFFVFGFGKIYQVIYQFLGSPAQSGFIVWLMTLVQAFVMGAIPGIIAVFMDDRPVRNVANVFVVVIMLCMAIISAALGGATAMVNLIFSLGTWLFVFGAVVGCFSMDRARNAS